MLDLSFTNDPQWQAERERLWQGIEKDLKANFRRKELNVILNITFSTGELLEHTPSERCVNASATFQLQTR